MRTGVPGGDPGDWQIRNANDLFKARWDVRLSWSIMVAVAAHGVLLLWSPTWESSDLPESDRLVTDRSQMEVIPLPEGALSPERQAPATVVVSDEQEPLAEESDPDDGVAETQWALADQREGLRERLRRRASPEPMIVEPAPEQPEVDSVMSEPVASEPTRDTVEVGGDASISDYEALAERGAVDLDRLSGVRPELAFPGSTARCPGSRR